MAWYTARRRAPVPGAKRGFGVHTTDAAAAFQAQAAACTCPAVLFTEAVFALKSFCFGWHQLSSILYRSWGFSSPAPASPLLPHSHQAGPGRRERIYLGAGQGKDELFCLCTHSSHRGDNPAPAAPQVWVTPCRLGMLDPPRSIWQLQHANRQVLQPPIGWARRHISWVGPGQVTRVHPYLPAPLALGLRHPLHWVAGEENGSSQHEMQQLKTGATDPLGAAVQAL